MADAMPDLGTLPRQAVGVKNLKSGVTVFKESVEWEQWENMLRFAYNHQDEIQIIMPGSAPRILEGAPARSPEIEAAVEADPDLVETTIGPDGGEVIDRQSLSSKHFKILVKMAKERKIDVMPGTTRLQLADMILAHESAKTKG